MNAGEYELLAHMRAAETMAGARDAEEALAGWWTREVDRVRAARLCARSRPAPVAIRPGRAFGRGDQDVGD